MGESKQGSNISQELFGEASKRRNKKKEARRKKKIEQFRRVQKKRKQDPLI